MCGEREVSAREQIKYNKSKSNPIVITNPFSPPKYTVTKRNTKSTPHTQYKKFSLIITQSHSHTLSLVNVESKNEELFLEKKK